MTIYNKLIHYKMLSSGDFTICNLRLVGNIALHEYIQTDKEGNILSYLEHSFRNAVSSAIYGENWTTTLFCLRKLYVQELPFLIKRLIKEKSNKELKKIGALLEKSIVGLENLKSVYQGTDSLAHIETIIDDFANSQLDTICEHLGMNNKDTLKSKLKSPPLKGKLKTIDEKKQE